MASVSEQIIANSNLTASIRAEQNANISKKGSSSVSSHEFLLLLTEQLKYQDPTNPMDNSQMLAQEAQFATLEQMESLTNSFSQFSSIYQANSLLGQNVEVNIDGSIKKGIVDYVDFSDTSGASVNIAGKNYPLSSVSKVYPKDVSEIEKQKEEDKNFFKDILSYTAVGVNEIANKLSGLVGANTSSIADDTSKN